MAEIGRSIERAKEILDSGGLVAIPTETVYGLAGNATNINSVAEIFAVKNRPSFDPLIVHSSSIQKFEELGFEIPNDFNPIIQKLWPGPLTILIPKPTFIPDLVTSGLYQVAIRVPDHPLCLELLERLDFPLAAPSANPFGYISPTTAQHVHDQLGKQIPYILDGGPCEVGLESTILGIENNTFKIYRKGGIPGSTLESILGEKAEIASVQTMPGSLKSHYAPSVPLIIGNPADWANDPDIENIGVISFQKKYPFINEKLQFILSSVGDMKEAARNLFAALRSLDQLKPSIIIAEEFPEDGLGSAINDRLQRAAS
jgi:L-threonylcarbamoyladenylate synthase